MERRILHLDIDAFLASVEQIREPALRGRPVAVGSGVVASRSYEAKARGVETAMSMGEARRICPELVVCDGDARTAERFRLRVAEVLCGFAPVVQVCSLDDMYADLTGVPLPAAAEAGLSAYAAQIRAAVHAATGLSVSQGVGRSKVVARMATRLAKPGGIRVVPDHAVAGFLGAHGLRDLPGIGSRTAERLAQWNLQTVADLQRIDRALLQEAFGARGGQIWWRAHGHDDAPHLDQGVVATPLTRSIARETSFEAVAADGPGAAFLSGMLCYLVDRAATALRAQQMVCRTVQVRVRHLDGVASEKSRSLPEATSRLDQLSAMALTLLHELLQRRVLVRLVGVTLSGLTPRPPRQVCLFGDDSYRHTKLDRAVDAVRGRHGFGKLVVGRAAMLLGQVTNTGAGFRLRTPSLTK